MRTNAVRRGISKNNLFGNSRADNERDATFGRYFASKYCRPAGSEITARAIEACNVTRLLPLSPARHYQKHIRALQRALTFSLAGEFAGSSRHYQFARAKGERGKGKVARGSLRERRSSSERNVKKQAVNPQHLPRQQPDPTIH